MSNEWIQCVECKKWRLLPCGLNPDNLPDQWFCHTEPFNGNCEMPEVTEMLANSITAGSDKSVVAYTDHNMGAEPSNSKEPPKKTKLLQKSVKNFFPKFKFDEAMEPLRISSENNNDAIQGNLATTVVNITEGRPRPRGRPKKF